ncbi:hypothetical protein VTK26DRAFT_4873 [Humicola hyalothermophila]
MLPAFSIIFKNNNMQLPSIRPGFAGRLLVAAGKPGVAPVCQPAYRLHFSTSRQVGAQNQVFGSVRNLDQFYTYQLLSSSSRTPLLTLWTTSWCPTCRVVAPLMKELVRSGVGEAEGGVGYCAVEFDAPDVMSSGLGATYMINSIPTLLSFDAGEAQIQTKVTDGRQLGDRNFLEEWIRNEARRHGNRGAGGPGAGANLLGGLFGKSN